MRVLLDPILHDRLHELDRKRDIRREADRALARLVGRKVIRMSVDRSATSWVEGAVLLVAPNITSALPFSRNAGTP